MIVFQTPTEIPCSVPEAVLRMPKQHRVKMGLYVIFSSVVTQPTDWLSNTGQVT